MKRFIITNLLALMAVPMLACFWVDNHNYYLFHVYDSSDFSERVDQITRNNWKAYLGMGEDEYFYFRAEDVIKAAREKNDPLMVSYVENLQKYLDCVNIEQRRLNEWNYPTKEEISGNAKRLQAVRTYAQSKLKTRLRSQHALLFMRCNMMLGRHQENITFWEQTASQYIETVYKDMMQNIYAGALYKTGQHLKAGEIFAEMGDYNSLMTQYYKKRSFVAIRQEYMQDPNAKTLPFLLQDFVNNAQEAYDHDGSGKLFVRDISKTEATQMINFCKQVVKEGKTEAPALWQSAQAWLEYMFGSKEKALSDIREACTMEGNEHIKDNARVLHLYINAALAPKGKDYDDWLAEELEWLKQKAEPDGYYDMAMNRITHQILTKHYADNSVTTAALLSAANSNEYAALIDTMKVADLEQFHFFTLKTPRTNLDKFLKKHLQKMENYAMEDLIGSKHLRAGHWEKAIEWLKDIPVNYYEKQGYAVYAANRRYNLGPWIKRQWLNNATLYSDTEWKLGQNPRLVFAKEMLKMEGETSVLSGEALKKHYYELAVRYAQASTTGDCWFLTRDSKSSYNLFGSEDIDYDKRAASLLQQAGDPKDFLLKEKVLCARAYIYMNPTNWYEEVWNEETYEHERKPLPESSCYQAWAALAKFEKANASQTSGYVSRCDEYDQFLKVFAQR